MSRIIIVSNRLPVTLTRNESGKLTFTQSSGGLATGLASLDESIERIWIGWAGKSIEDSTERKQITQDFHENNLIPLYLSQEEVERFYLGFSNRTVWPMFHYFPQYVEYDEDNWDTYRSVNQKFAEKVAEHYRPGDLVWIHDYQLMLVPGMVRKQFPEASIGFFLHIPFPSFELFRLMPWREELLEGLLGSDLVGFHDFGYMRHFLSSVYRIYGLEQNFGKLAYENRTVNVDVFPMGINYEKYARGGDGEKITEEVRFIKEYGNRRKLILSIDRLDYSKGIIHRILAYERFLSDHPEYQGEVTLILVVVPSRDKVPTYQQLKEQIDTTVGRINGRMGQFNWIPIRYYYRSFPFDSLSAMYKSAHVALITPLRDGMNLVAKEFVAAREDSQTGVLILSEMAGAASDLPEAILINPNDQRDIVAALKQALEMPVEAQAERLFEMQKNLKKYDIAYWANSFIDQLMKTKEQQRERQTNLLNEVRQNELLTAYQTAEQRLLLLDYDGTLVGFVNNPNDARPDAELLEILQKLHAQEKTTVVIISGRDRYTLEEWLGDVGIEIISEHGVWRWRDEKWHLNEGVNANWKAEVRPILDNLVDRTPGSFVEEKDYTLAWHYRQIDRELGDKRVREIRDGLVYLTANHNLQVLEGNKVVEVRNAGVNKGKAASGFFARDPYDFALAIGDDHTDEDTFLAMPEDAYTIKVGLNRTAARFKVKNTHEARALLQKMSELD